ncbi:guanyl-nucleotide exchange factor [Lithospermum erythrorhizon]|uniref:Guanyl-nucleotide exchange factor n=1 Tax=Lithospermum erythrorhizon TaxID=34254 RepID=A0AAV3QQR5_LITER
MEEESLSSPAFVHKVLYVSAGASHSVALLSGNVVCSWGKGEDGQLGLGDAEDRINPTRLSALDDLEIISVSCGADHTIAYSDSRLQIYSWGWGDFGRLGHGNSSDLFSPMPIKALQYMQIKQIACGDSHCIALTIEGELLSWGRNQNGQLGLGTTEDSLVPQRIHTFMGIPVKMVAAGAEHTAAVTEDGELYGWGWGRYGNLGLGDRNDRLVPEKVSVDKMMVLVACGWRHTISVSSTRGIFTFGWGKYGQLGHGDFEDRLVPHMLDALQDELISQISGGWRHTMALGKDGKLYGWGWNKFGQVGVGDNVDHCSPVQVRFPLDQKIIQISCGWRHTLAVSEEHNVFSWGRGTNGQLGHGDSVDRNVPKIIDTLSIDGTNGQQIEAPRVDLLSGGLTSAEKTWISPMKKYAIVPDKNVPDQANALSVNVSELSVPEHDVKRMRV